MRTLRKQKWMVPVILLLTVAGCTTIQVSQDYDPENDFSHYETWQWREAEQRPTGDIRIDNPLLDKRIRNAIENHLTERDLEQTDSSPGLLFSYSLVIEKRIYSDSHYSHSGVGAYRYPWYWGGSTETRIYQYDQSRLIIDIHDAAAGIFLWRGEGVYLLTTFKTPQDAGEAMQKIVDKILQQFPPAPLSDG